MLRFRRAGHEVPDLVTVGSHEKVGAAIEAMQRHGISQVVRDEPVDSLADVVGSLQERGLLERVFLNADALSEDVAVAMQPPLPAVDADASIDEVYEGSLGGLGRGRRGERGRGPPGSSCAVRSAGVPRGATIAGATRPRRLGADRHVDGADDDEGAGERPRARPLAEEASRARSRRAG